MYCKEIAISNTVVLFMIFRSTILNKEELTGVNSEAFECSFDFSLVFHHYSIFQFFRCVRGFFKKSLIQSLTISLILSIFNFLLFEFCVIVAI